MDKFKKFVFSNKRIIFFVLVALILIYPLYTIINYYTSDRVTSVSLTFFESEKNIVTRSDAEYEMKINDGSVQIEQSAETFDLDGLLSSAIKLSSLNGNTVKKVNLTICYDETKLQISENDIVLVKLSQDGKNVTFEKFTIDTDINTVKTTVSADGTWYLADKNIIN